MVEDGSEESSEVSEASKLTVGARILRSPGILVILQLHCPVLIQNDRIEPRIENQIKLKKIHTIKVFVFRNKEGSPYDEWFKGNGYSFLMLMNHYNGLILVTYT